MNHLLDEIYSLGKAEMEECSKHLMLGGGTRSMPVIRNGKGVRVYDVDGNSYIDCTSQSWAMYLGHANEEINETLCDHLRSMSHMQDWVLENTRNMGAYIRSGLEMLQEEYPEIGDIRQAGLHIGVEMVKDPEMKEPAVDAANGIRKHCQSNGLILGKGGPCSQVLKIKPPLIVSREECDEILNIFGDALRVALRR